MSCFSSFFPDYRLSSVYALTVDWLRNQGINGLILDIDNTLVSPDAPADEAARGLVDAFLQAGIACLVLSNNSLARAEGFAAALGCPYVAKAKKPRPEGFLKALELLGTPRESTLVVGDQLLTDVYGAHRAGLKCLLVDALDPAHEQPFVRLKRLVEKPLLRAFRREQEKSRKNS